MLLVVVQQGFYMATEGVEHSAIVCLVVVTMPARLLDSEE